MSRRRTPGDGGARGGDGGARGDREGGARGDRDGGAGGGSAGQPADRPVRVAVRVRPGAGRTRAGGRYDGPHGPALVVAVGAPAVDGRATEAVRRVLAAALGVRAAAVSLRFGATSRDKVFAVDADPHLVIARLQGLRDGPTVDSATENRAAGDRAAGDRAAGDRAAGDRGGT